MLILNIRCYKIGCKVTHFLSLTQIFCYKTACCVHTQGVIVQVFGRFLVILTLLGMGVQT